MSCNSGINVSIENPSDFDRTEIVEIHIGNHLALPAGKAYQVTNRQGAKSISQLTYDGKLIFPVFIKAKETVAFSIKTGVPEEYPAKTYGRFVVERYEDFAWENDRVAFRVYGNALIPIDGPSNGIDLWYKRTSDLIIDKWYKDHIAEIRSYHEDNGEGLDEYSVGRTLGGGAMAPFVKDSLFLNNNFVAQELLENGPLRTTFKLAYSDITVDGNTFSESRTFSIDAGSQMTKVTQEYGTQNAITVAGGIVQRGRNHEFHTIRTDKGAALIYEEPQISPAGKVFVGMVFPNGIVDALSHTHSLIHARRQTQETHTHLLGVVNYNPRQPITYYTGFGWEKFGFPAFSDFYNYLNNFLKALEEPLIIKF